MSRTAASFVGRSAELAALDEALDAAELYLSTKTVETHLRNLFHKLGVSSRVEVARAVERADAASPAGPAAS